MGVALALAQSVVVEIAVEEVHVEMMIILASELLCLLVLKLLNKNYIKQLTPSQQQCDARQTIIHAASSGQRMYSKVLLL